MKVCTYVEAARHVLSEHTLSVGESVTSLCHFHRDEHWVVVEGTVTLSTESSKQLLPENASVFIKRGTRHQFSNEGKLPARMYCVSYGEFREDD